MDDLLLDGPDKSFGHAVGLGLFNIGDQDCAASLATEVKKWFLGPLSQRKIPQSFRFGSRLISSAAW